MASQEIEQLSSALARLPGLGPRSARRAVLWLVKNREQALPALLEALGAETIPLDCEPNGAFTRVLEPLPEHLGALGERVRESGADLGVALDGRVARVPAIEIRVLGAQQGFQFSCHVGVHKSRANRKHRNAVRFHL